MTPEQKEKKAYRKAKLQREKAAKEKKINSNNAKRLAGKKLEVEPLKLDFRVEMPVLDDDNEVLKRLKTTIHEGNEFISATLHKKVKPKDPALTIEVIVKNDKTKKRQSYGFNYYKLEKALKSGVI